MTDHPAIAELESIKLQMTSLYPDEKAAIDTAIAAIRALQALRPHHPDTIVGRRYAHMFVSFDALMEAQKVVGLDNALPRFDIEAARLGHTQDRAAHYQGVDGADNRKKWTGR